MPSRTYSVGTARRRPGRMRKVGKRAFRRKPAPEEAEGAAGAAEWEPPEGTAAESAGGGGDEPLAKKRKKKKKKKDKPAAGLLR